MNPHENSWRTWAALVGWFALTWATAAVGAAASVQAAPFYAELVRPAWAPPGWLFGPVWTVLYTLMAIAAWLVWRARGLDGARTALVLFGVQLIANALWSWLFFVWRLGGVASLEVITLWCLVLATVLAFWRENKLAGALLLPYLAWVTLASALTVAVWRLNPALLG